MNPTIGDVCCGIGGMAAAFAREGFRSEWACDIDPIARATYTANHAVKPLGDLWHIRPSQVPYTDVVVAGIPCQSFSSMGRHGLWDDPRSWVIKPLAGLLCRRRPKVVVIENVVGMTTKRKSGPPLRFLLDVLADCGYKTSWKVLDAAEFGGAQRRRRVFVVGDREGRELDWTRLETSPSGRFQDVLEASIPSGCWLAPSAYRLLPRPSPPTQGGLVLAGWLSHRQPRGPDVSRLGHHHHAARIYHPSGLAPTMMCRSGLAMLAVGPRVRRPTELEIQRLQGFPDSYVWPLGSVRRRHLLGQTVHLGTVQAVAKAVGEQLLA